MGYFRDIRLVNFRNFDSYKLEFSNYCNVFYGKNGSGKTNILEALSLFNKGRGFKKDKLSNLINSNSNKFIIKSDFENNETVYNLSVETKNLNKKFFKNLKVNNDKSYEVLKKIYKLVPFLIFLPETERLFISSPSTRRNFLDRLIFSYTDNYNQLINKYNKNIIERSQLLKVNNHDNNWLDQIEKNISNAGLQIYLSREQQVNSLIEYLNNFLSDFKLPYSLNVKLSDNFFHNTLNEELFSQQLKKNRKIDSQFGGSKVGPHKSDYLFYVNNEYLASQLSTGQQKTLILLIFLSQCKYLIDKFNRKPILLLDEICSHLDDLNRKILLTLVESFELQVFMTGTTKNLFSFLSTNTKFYNITN